MLRALIIDDEPIARRVLRNLIEQQPALTLVGEAGTFDQALTRLAANDYELVFLDIQLRGGNGFDLVPAVQPGARIVFVTAFDRFALRAFEVNALDYLLKPVTPERFATLLARVGNGAASNAGATISSAQPWPSTQPPLTADDSVYIRSDAGNRFVPLASVAAVFSNQNYSDVYLRSGERIFTRCTMKTWERTLPGAQFARVHRQAFVNIALIEALTRDAPESAIVRVSGVRGDIDVSRRYLDDIEARLKARAG